MSRRSARPGRPAYLRRKDEAAGLVLLALGAVFGLGAVAAVFAWIGRPLGGG